MVKKAYVHIGMPKTGSSSIQSLLTENRNNLLDEGVLYPKTGRLAAHGIAQQHISFVINDVYPDWIPLKARMSFKQLKKELYSELRSIDHSTLVISSEAFSSIQSTDKIQALCELLNGYEVHVIALVRRPDQWIQSWYKQVVKSHPFTTATFDSFVSTNRMHHFENLKVWEAVVGAQSINVLHYDKLSAEGSNSILKVILHCIGIKNQDPLLEKEVVNESPSWELIELCRRLNMDESLGTPQKKQIFKELFRWSKDVNLSSECIPPYVDWEAVIDSYASDLQYVNRTYGVDLVSI